MGTSIEFDRLAVTFETTDRYGRSETTYLLVHKTGASNVLDNKGRIVREWAYYTIGNSASVIRRLARAAYDIETGMVRYQNGRTKIENYIRNWRNEMDEDNAISVTEFANRFPHAELRVVEPDKEIADDAAEAYNTITDEWAVATTETKSYTERDVYKAPITAANLELFNQLSEETHIWIEF